MSSLSLFEKLKLSAPGYSFSKLLPAVVIFVFAAVFVPVVGPLFLFFLPMILFVSGILNGTFRTSLYFFFSFAALLLLSVLLRQDTPAVAVFTIGMTGIFMALFADRNYSVEKTIIFPALFMIGAVCVYFGYDAVALGVHPWQLVKNFIAVTISETVKFYSQMPLKAEDILVIKDNEQNIVAGFIGIFPALVVISSVVIVWANLLSGRNYLFRSGQFQNGFRSLASWKVPDMAIWIFIISGALMFIPQKDINFMSLNVFLIICFVYLLQGFAIVSFLFQVKNVPVFFRYLYYFLIAVQQILMIPIALIGLFDIWFDFRKFIQKKQATD